MTTFKQHKITGIEREELKDEIMDLLVDNDALRIINTPSVKQYIERIIDEKIDKVNIRLSKNVTEGIEDMFDETLQETIFVILNNLLNSDDSIKRRLALVIPDSIKDHNSIVSTEIKSLAREEINMQVNNLYGSMRNSIKNIAREEIMAQPDKELIREMIKEEINKKEYKQVFVDTNNTTTTNRPIKI